MLKFFGKWFKVYQDEIGIFVWCAALLFLIRSSNVLFNNFAETAFLKRFGVEYLPIVYMVNSVSTFFIMGVMTGTMGGIFRDILCHEQPVVFQSPLYATVSWGGSLLFIYFIYLNLDITLAAGIAGMGIFLTRLLAIKFNISLPRFRFKS